MGGRPLAMGCGRSYSGKTPPEIVAKSLEILKQAAAIVSAKAPADAAAFKGWLQHISQVVAEASTRGRFSRVWRRDH